MNDGRLEYLERRIAELESRTSSLPARFGIGGGGSSGGSTGSLTWIKGTKNEIDSLINAGLIAPQIAYATDLARYYHLVTIGGIKRWQAWSFLE